MNPKLLRVYNDIERTQAKIAELQGILPELEKQKTELENLEIIKMIRSANIAPVDLPAFVDAYRAGLSRRDASPPALVKAAESREREEASTHEDE